MNCRRSLAITALGLTACDEILPPPFQVTFSFPANDAVAFPESPVRIGFSRAIDEEACADALSLVAIGDAPQVAWSVPFALEPWPDKPDTWELVHEDDLIVGFEHLLTVETGAGGCTSVGGDALGPFAARFRVDAQTAVDE